MTHGKASLTESDIETIVVGVEVQVVESRPLSVIGKVNHVGGDDVQEDMRFCRYRARLPEKFRCPPAPAS